MKKAAAVLLCLVCAALALTGCAEGSKKKETAKMTTAATTTRATTSATTRVTEPSVPAETTSETSRTDADTGTGLPGVTGSGETEARDPMPGTGETLPGEGTDIPQGSGGSFGSGN